MTSKQRSEVGLGHVRVTGIGGSPRKTWQEERQPRDEWEEPGWWFSPARARTYNVVETAAVAM